MKIHEVKKFISEAVSLTKDGKYIVPYLWGPPGIGKSAAVKQVAKSENIQLIDLRLSLLDGTDLRGLPKFDDGHVFWARPEFIPEDGEGILFLDELNTALPAVQNAALQLVYDRRVGPHQLGGRWLIVCASNRKEQGAHVWNLSSAMVSRVVHINCEVDVDDFISYAIHSGIIVEEIIAFIKFRPGLLYEAPKRTDTPFPTPRAYEFLSGLKNTWNLEVVSGVIGEGPANEFMNFIKIYKDLPDIDGILEKGIPFTVPKEPSVMVALITGVCARANEKNISNVMKVLEKVSSEFSVFGMKMLFARGLKETIMRLSSWKEWVARHKDVIL